MTEPSWVALHCLQCWRTPSECLICGCHEPRKEADQMVPSTTVFTPKCETMEVRKTAPERCANTSEGLTTNDAVGVAMAAPNLTPSTALMGGGRVA